MPTMPPARLKYSAGWLSRPGGGCAQAGHLPDGNTNSRLLNPLLDLQEGTDLG